MAVPPGSRGEAAYRFQPELRAVAKYPNVAVKATGQPGYAEDAYPFRSFHEHLHRCFDAFGPDRMFWGTDITRMPCSWRQCVTVFTEELPWLKGRDLDLVMGEALCNWVGWPLPARRPKQP
jgi:predicted TIM-barrel fold metal-dependent hydrolase